MTDERERSQLLSYSHLDLLKTREGAEDQILHGRELECAGLAGMRWNSEQKT